MSEIPSAKEEVRDFGLGLTSPAVMTPVIYGVSSLGTPNELEFYSSLQTLRDERGEGPAVETAANVLDKGGGPIGFVTADPSIAGLIGFVYAHFQSSGSSGAVTKVGTGPTVTVAGPPNGFWTVRLKVTTGGILGTSKVDLSLDGGTTYILTAIPTAATLLLGDTGVTATMPAGTYVLNDTYTFTTTGGGGKITASGIATLDARVRVKMKTGGALGVATFQYSCDAYAGDTESELTYSEVLTVPGGGTFVVPGLGTTLTFDATVPFVAGDTYYFDVEAAAWNAADLADGFAPLAASPKSWRYVTAVTSQANGDAVAHAVLTAALQAQLDALATSSRYRRGMMPGDQGDTASSVSAAYQNTVATRCLVAYGKVRRSTTKPFPGYAFPVTHSVDCFAARGANSLPSTDLKRVRSGPLVEIVKIFHDERANPTTLDDVKISTVRTYQEIEGFYITQARLKSPSGSDFKLWPLGLVMDIACETVHSEMVLSIGRGIRWNSDGTIDNGDAVSIEEDVAAKLIAQLTSPTNAEGFQGFVQKVQYRIDRHQNVQSTGVLIGTVGIKPLGYIDYIRTILGFVVDIPTAAAA